MGNDECALLKLLSELFLCAFDSHGSCVECVADCEMRKLRNTAYSAERNLLICAYSVIDAYRNAVLLVEVECDHASDQRRMLGEILRPCQEVDHCLVDTYCPVRTRQDIAAS